MPTFLGFRWRSRVPWSGHWYRRTPLEDLLGVSTARVNSARLCRALDQLPPHQEALQVHLKQRLSELFESDYELLLYDVTST